MPAVTGEIQAMVRRGGAIGPIPANCRWQGIGGIPMSDLATRLPVRRPDLVFSPAGTGAGT